MSMLAPLGQLPDGSSSGPDANRTQRVGAPLVRTTGRPPRWSSGGGRFVADEREPVL